MHYRNHFQMNAGYMSTVHAYFDKAAVAVTQIRVSVGVNISRSYLSIFPIAIPVYLNSSPLIIVHFRHNLNRQIGETYDTDKMRQELFAWTP